MDSLKKIRNVTTKRTIEWYLEAGYFYGTMNEREAQRIARVDRSTWQRWMQAKTAAPAATLELLRLHAFGEPPGGFDAKAWAGWRFVRGLLVSPHGDAYDPGTIQAAEYWRKLALSYMDTPKPLTKGKEQCA